jgi:hypothetical protein
MIRSLSFVEQLEIIQARLDFTKSANEKKHTELPVETLDDDQPDIDMGRKLGWRFQIVNIVEEISALTEEFNLEEATLMRNFQLFLYYHLNSHIKPSLNRRTVIEQHLLPTLDSPNVSRLLN